MTTAKITDHLSESIQAFLIRSMQALQLRESWECFSLEVPVDVTTANDSFILDLIVECKNHEKSKNAIL